MLNDDLLKDQFDKQEDVDKENSRLNQDALSKLSAVDALKQNILANLAERSMIYTEIKPSRSIEGISGRSVIHKAKIKTTQDQSQYRKLVSICKSHNLPESIKDINHGYLKTNDLIQKIKNSSLNFDELLEVTRFAEELYVKCIENMIDDEGQAYPNFTLESFNPIMQKFLIKLEQLRLTSNTKSPGFTLGDSKAPLAPKSGQGVNDVLLKASEALKQVDNQTISNSINNNSQIQEMNNMKERENKSEGKQEQGQSTPTKIVQNQPNIQSPSQKETDNHGTPEQQQETQQQNAVAPDTNPVIDETNTNNTPVVIEKQQSEPVSTNESPVPQLTQEQLAKEAAEVNDRIDEENERLDKILEERARQSDEAEQERKESDEIEEEATDNNEPQQLNTVAPDTNPVIDETNTNNTPTEPQQQQPDVTSDDDSETPIILGETSNQKQDATGNPNEVKPNLVLEKTSNESEVNEYNDASQLLPNNSQPQDLTQEQKDELNKVRELEEKDPKGYHDKIEVEEQQLKQPDPTINPNPEHIRTQQIQQDQMKKSNTSVPYYYENSSQGRKEPAADKDTQPESSIITNRDKIKTTVQQTTIDRKNSEDRQSPSGTDLSSKSTSEEEESKVSQVRPPIVVTQQSIGNTQTQTKTPGIPTSSTTGATRMVDLDSSSDSEEVSSNEERQSNEGGSGSQSEGKSDPRQQSIPLPFSSIDVNAPQYTLTNSMTQSDGSSKDTRDLLPPIVPPEQPSTFSQLVSSININFGKNSQSLIAEHQVRNTEQGHGDSENERSELHNVGSSSTDARSSVGYGGGSSSDEGRDQQAQGNGAGLTINSSVLQRRSPTIADFAQFTVLSAFAFYGAYYLMRKYAEKPVINNLIPFLAKYGFNKTIDFVNWQVKGHSPFIAALTASVVFCFYPRQSHASTIATNVLAGVGVTANMPYELNEHGVIKTGEWDAQNVLPPAVVGATLVTSSASAMHDQGFVAGIKHSAKSLVGANRDYGPTHPVTRTNVIMNTAHISLCLSAAFGLKYLLARYAVPLFNKQGIDFVTQSQVNSLPSLLICTGAAWFITREVDKGIKDLKWNESYPVYGNTGALIETTSLAKQPKFVSLEKLFYTTCAVAAGIAAYKFLDTKAPLILFGGVVIASWIKNNRLHDFENANKKTATNLGLYDFGDRGVACTA